MVQGVRRGRGGEKKEEKRQGGEGDLATNDGLSEDANLNLKTEYKLKHLTMMMQTMFHHNFQNV